MKKIIFLILCCIFLSGCAAFMEGYNKAAEQAREARRNTYVWDSYNGCCYYYDYQFEIISDPPGAKIEWNNDYIGTTPLRRIMNGPIGSLATIVVKANPVEPGQYTQTKVLWGNQPLPKTIYFNMNLEPATPEYNINIQNR